jgi:hypothetical protein
MAAALVANRLLKEGESGSTGRWRKDKRRNWSAVLAIVFLRTSFRLVESDEKSDGGEKMSGKKSV